MSVYCLALRVYLCESTTFSPNFPMQCIPPSSTPGVCLQCIYSPTGSTTTYLPPSSSASPSNCVHHCEVSDVTWACTRCIHHAIFNHGNRVLVVFFTMATVCLLHYSPWQQCACCILHHGNSVLAAFFTMATVCLLCCLSSPRWLKHCILFDS